MPGYILLVDDNPNNLRLLIAILRERGYQIRPANSGPRALAMIEKERPDLILLDINMPGMDGYEVCRRLKQAEETRDIPVLFISASDEMEDKLKSFEAGAVDYITKPFQEAEVLARISTQLTIQRQRRQLESVLDSSQDGIMAYEARRDPSGAIIDFQWLVVNPTAAQMLGKSRKELTGQLLLEHFPFVREAGIFGEYVAVVETGRALDKEVYLEAFGRWIHLMAVKLDDGLAVTFRDTSERKYMELELAKLAQLDGLTGIANRRVFDQQLSREWKRCARQQEPLAVIMCDIDFFKLYNDSCGHLEGDRCLIQVAQALSATIRRPGDLVARYGGEEFGVILPDTHAEGAIEVARNLAAAVRALGLPHPARPLHTPVSLSIGVASMVPQPQDSELRLLANADEALYLAKEMGRDQVQAWQEPLQLERPGAAV
ncbi:MAG TPA: diguanylate cyclase [Candidatus Obscuribacterales bacterium]